MTNDQWSIADAQAAWLLVIGDWQFAEGAGGSGECCPGHNGLRCSPERWLDCGACARPLRWSPHPEWSSQVLQVRCPQETFASRKAVHRGACARPPKSEIAIRKSQMKSGVPDRLRSGDLLHERQACCLDYTTGTEMERVNGIAPLSRPWHGRILLLNHTRVERLLCWSHGVVE